MRNVVGRPTYHVPSGIFLETVETTLIPASSINQRVSKKSLTGNARLDNEANVRRETGKE
jgi:hypothetical protein